MLTFPKYETYQDSNISWLQDIPGSWKIERAKWLFKKMERPVRQEDEVVTAFRDGQVTLRKNRREEGFTNALQEHGYQGIRKGDLVIHAMDAFAGAIGVSDSDGKSTPVYSVCIPRGQFYVNNHYYAYLLRYMALSGFIQSLAKGIRERSTDFRFNDFANLCLPIPSKEEQDRIVDFLDRKTSEIDQAIAQKQRLIELLQEQKAILINQAITKGLNSNVQMRDSGISWIGEIPEHWELPQFRYCCDVIKDGLHTTPPKHDEGVNFISTQHVRNRRIALDSATYISEKDYRQGHPKVKPEPGDVLVTLVGSIGFAALVESSHMPVSCTRHVGYVRCKPELLTQEYFINYTESHIFKCFIEENVSQTAQPSIYLASLASHRLPLPPVDEQKEINIWLSKSITPFLELIETTLSEISILNELKQIYISEAVTGKIKV